MTQLDIDSYKQRITKVTGSTKGADGIFWQHFDAFCHVFSTYCNTVWVSLVFYRAISCRVAAASKSGGKKGLACLTDCASTPKHELMMSLMCQMLGPCLDSASNYVCSIIYSITPFVIPESF